MVYSPTVETVGYRNIVFSWKMLEHNPLPYFLFLIPYWLFNAYYKNDFHFLESAQQIKPLNF